MEEYKYPKLNPKTHICPVCNRLCKWLCVHEINPNAPCSEECRNKQKKDKN